MMLWSIRMRLLLSCFVVFVPALASAQTIGIDGAACSFNTVAAAIAAAPANSTIYIQPSLRTEFVGTIAKNLTFVPSTAGRPGFSGCEIEHPSATSSTVIFQANGSSQNATGGMVRVSSGASVTFRHMSFRDATATNGGVMAVTGGARVFLDDADVYDGVASSSGGGVYVSGGILVLNNGSVIRENSTTFGNGGGIAVQNGTLTLNNGSVGGSIAWGNNSANEGGGIYANLSAVTLRGASSIIGFNSAGHNGGGIAAYSSQLVVEDLDVNGNSAFANGGGIYIEDSTSTLTITGARIRNNLTTNSTTNEGGGGIWAFSGVTGVIENTVIENNDSDNLGGGIGWRSGGSLILRNASSVVGNTASASGGGFYVVTSVDLVVDGSEVSNNQSGHSGGAIYLLGGSLQLDDSELFQNLADRGGALALAFVEDVDIKGSFLSQNVVSENGGAIHANDVQMTMSDVTFTLNQAGDNGGTMYLIDSDSTLLASGVVVSASETTTSSTNEGGGCFYIEDALSVVFNDLTMDSCDSQNLGGAFFIESVDSITLNDSSISFSEGTIGGGFYVLFSALTLDNVIVANNEARSNSGGGIYAFGVPTSLTVLNSTIRDNTADAFGGGIYAAFNQSLVENTIIEGNSAGLRGGGIYASQGVFEMRTRFPEEGEGGCSPFMLAANTYCTEVRGNSASEGGGIAVVGDANEPVIYSTLFAAEGVALIDNTAISNGSAFFTDQLQTSSTMSNMLIRGHTTTAAVFQDGPTELSITQSSFVANFVSPLRTESVDSILVLSNSILWDNVSGPFVRSGATFSRACNDSQPTLGGSQSMGSIDQDPIFESTDRGDYRLSEFSPAIDACLAGVPVDLDGVARLDGNDMGAFEFPVPEPALLVGLSSVLWLAALARRRQQPTRAGGGGRGDGAGRR